jgi:sialic acid synthase SpsE/quercetin dioxygenase-like cupin family protein
MTPPNDILYIFEMANNHQGDVQHGLRIIDAMAKIARDNGIRGAVKFQYRDLDTFIHPAHQVGDSKHIKRFLETRLTREQYMTLVDATRDAGLVTMCTPFDESSVKDIVNDGIEIIKVASCSANDWPLLEAVAAARKPVICSTGGLRIEQIDQVVNFLEHRNVDFSVLHCVGIYPTPTDGLYLNFMERMMDRYNWLRVGYSGHEDPDDTDVVKVAVAKGARILERHVGVPTDTVKLNAYSMNPEQTDSWVKASIRALRIGGAEGREKRVVQAEVDSLQSLRRGTFVRGPVRKGEALTADKIYFAMPCADGQTASCEWLPTMVASRDYTADEGLVERREASLTSSLRSLVHQGKGMLYEAGIKIGPKYTVEMSHHYGPENFRSHGALIVNLINREYCKKLVIVFPGQRHPNHRHQKKEEVFQVLHGDLEAVIDGNVHHLKPGDMVLVERGNWHSFSSVGGCVFEEVSTTHIVGDSYYEDEKIAQLDPMQRKTTLDMW